MPATPCTAGVISANSSGGMSDIRVMHVMSQILNFLYRPIPTRERLHASGMAVVFVSTTQLKVIKIRPESPATLAGVEAGDEIVELQGQRPADLSLFQVQELLAQDGKIIKVVLDRNGDRLEKNLHLKRPFLYPPVWETTDEDSGEFEKFLEQNRRKSAAKSK